GMASGALRCKRTVESLNPGDPFRMVSARHGFSGEVMRVGDMTFGDGRENEIGLKFVQDVFDLGSDLLIEAGTSAWEDPATDPEPLSPRYVEEMPYREMVQMVGADADVMLAGNPDAGLLQVAGSTSD